MSKYNRVLLFLSMATAVMCVTVDAYAAVAGGGGGMPYSQGLNTLSNSVKTEIAGALIIIGVVMGIGVWMYGGQLDGLLMSIMKLIVAACIIGGVGTFLTSIGVTGALLT
jgi:type IV secretory pathway VirB2 component (pilin)